MEIPIEENILNYAIEFLKEVLKNNLEYFKHLTTLNSGSILIVIGLAKGIFSKPVGMIFVAISFVLLLISLIGAIYMLQVINGYNYALFTSLIETLSVTKENECEILDKLNKSINSITKTITIFHPIIDFSFVLGILSIIVFSIMNFMQ